MKASWLWYRKRMETDYDRQFPTVRVLAYSEGYVMLRYRGAMTHCLSLTEFLEHFQPEPPMEGDQP